MPIVCLQRTPPHDSPRDKALRLQNIAGIHIPRLPYHSEATLEQSTALGVLFVFLRSLSFSTR